MLRLIIKSVGWIIRHLALFLVILFFLGLGGSLLSIPSKWQQITSEPEIDNPIEELAADLHGVVPSIDQGAVCKSREVNLKSQRDQLTSLLSERTAKYQNLKFYRIDKIDEKLELELEVRKVASQIGLIDQAIVYLQDCQSLANIEKTRRQCDTLKRRCISLIRQCGMLEASFPRQCTTFERFVPPWTKFCPSHKERIDSCNRTEDEVCREKAAVCKLVEGTEAKAIGEFKYDVTSVSNHGTITNIISELSVVSDVFVTQSPKAFAILLSIIFSPLLVNVVVFFGLARLVEHAYKFRLVESSEMSFGEKQKARDIIDIDLRIGQELIVKPEFIRNVPENATASTKFFLSSIFPFASLASGLYMLTRFSAGSDSASIKLSESSSTEIKLSVISLSAGDQVVLSPRHVVGVIQKSALPIQISSKWLLTRPSAWLAGQLRVLVLSGPGDIILKGGRGIVIQQVKQNAPVQCDGVIGYSANMLVQHQRTETFWAFHRNKRDLFKYRFSGASGTVLQETQPGRKQVNVSGWSLQRLGDLILNLFGI